MAYPDRTQGTSHFNTVAADGADIKVINGSSISGSALVLPATGGLGGMAQVVTGTTGAAGATKSLTHSLGAAPSWAGVTGYDSNGSAPVNITSKGTGAILVVSAIGSIAVEAFVIK